MMNRISFLVVATAAGALGAAAVIAPFVHSLGSTSIREASAPAVIAAAAAAVPDAVAARGRYVIATSGCNDCHTPGYMTNDGTTPEQEWLKGDALGWQGPWGTTYAMNLRITVKDKTVTIRLNGKEVVSWTQPADWGGGREGAGRALGSGTFALQGHDPNSTVHYKNIRVKPLP